MPVVVNEPAVMSVDCSHYMTTLAMEELATIVHIDDSIPRVLYLDSGGALRVPRNTVVS